VTVIDTLKAWGIQRPEQVVEISSQTGLPLALGCAILDQESGGGRNVWGHDGGANVKTGGSYTPGAPVTQEAYQRYRKLADANVIIRQGVGPMQLTARSWQDAADARGGCWDPYANTLAGFTGLVALVNRYGLPDGVRRYNGSGFAAEAYRDKVLTRYRAWTDRLGPQAQPPPKGLDDVAWTHDEGAPAVPDLYPGRPKGSTLPDPLIALAWTAANAGRAVDAATSAAQTAARIESLVNSLRQSPPQIDYSQLAAAIIVQLAQVQSPSPQVAQLTERESHDG
jgi:hypothetical protein